jgi:outer membrane protein assembly factor BamE (lipoprotein component of BamABCDE complex)
MKHLSILTLMLALLLCGCQTTGHIDRGALSRVNLGMTKQEVIASLGTPESVSAERGTETLTYVEQRPWFKSVKVQIKFSNGKVTAYGEVPPPEPAKSKN